MKRVIALLAVLATLAFQPLRAVEPVLALKAGHVFDSRAGRVGGAQVILVEKGRISAMGPGLAIPAGATVIDLSTQTVMPGLIEAHAHLLQEHPGDEHNTLTVTKAVVMEGDPLRALRGACPQLPRGRLHHRT